MNSIHLININFIVLLSSFSVFGLSFMIYYYAEDVRSVLFRYKAKIARVSLSSFIIAVIALLGVVESTYALVNVDSDKFYLSEQINTGGSSARNFRLFYVNDYDLQEGCYVSYKDKLEPGYSAMLQADGAVVWVTLQSDNQTLQEVEYVIKVDDFYLYKERSVELKSFNLSDFKKCPSKVNR